MQQRNAVAGLALRSWTVRGHLDQGADLSPILQPVTETPPGTNLERLQASLSGSTVLPWTSAARCRGADCRRRRKVAAGSSTKQRRRLSVGALLWTTTQVEAAPPSGRDGQDAADHRGSASAGEGTEWFLRAKRETCFMAQNAGDRVIAILRDGDPAIRQPRYALPPSCERKTFASSPVVWGLAAREMLAVISLRSERGRRTRPRNRAGSPTRSPTCPPASNE